MMMGGMRPQAACYYSALIGLALTAAMVVITEYYTGTDYKPGQDDRGGLADRRRAPTSSPASVSP